jgi:hypothetical protein
VKTAHRSRRSPVDFAPVAHVEQLDFVQLRVEPVDDPIVPDPQSIPVEPRETIVREPAQVFPDFVDAGRNFSPHGDGKGEEVPIKSSLENLLRIHR